MTDKPQAHNQFMDEFPTLAAAYEQLGSAAHQAGPLDDKTRQLVKLGLAVDARHEGAVHAHTRLAIEAGVSGEAIKQVVALAATTLGMPNAVAAYTWVNDVLES